MFSTFICVVIAVYALILTVIGCWLLWVAIRSKIGRPVVCVCKVENRVGVVLKKDLDAESHAFWKHQDGFVRGDLQIPSCHSVARHAVEPAFVFSDGMELRVLLSLCFVEAAVFQVSPQTLNDLEQLGAAHLHFFGEPFGRKEDKTESIVAGGMAD